MPGPSKGEIESRARDALVSLWKLRRAELGVDPDLQEFLRTAPECYIRSILGLEILESEHISGTLSAGRSDLRVQDASGYLDRTSRTVAVVQNLPAEWRRFTLAHEIGHWHLHEDEILFRDGVITGAETGYTRRPLAEKQADWFAAAFLMPEKAIRDYFERTIGEPVDSSQLTGDQKFWLDHASCRGDSRRQIALTLANLKTFGGHFFQKISDRFGVSPTAMALRLEELNLVK